MGRRTAVGLRPGEVRVALGEGFSLDMAGRVQERLDVDVLVMDIEGDAYTLQVAGRHVLVVKKTAVWTRQNFSLAHELAHICAADFTAPPRTCDEADEATANQFAAELLMPEAELRAVDWERLDASGLASQVWERGVSTEALRIRLETLDLPVGPEVAELLDQNTFALLRRHWPGRHDKPDPITARRERSASRVLPAELASRIEAKVSEGAAPPESLAFVLDVPVDEVEADLPVDDTLDDDLALLRELAGE